MHETKQCYCCNQLSSAIAQKPLQAKATLAAAGQEFRERRRLRATIATPGVVAADAAVSARCRRVAVVVENSFRWRSEFLAVCRHRILASLQRHAAGAICRGGAVLVHLDLDRIQLRSAASARALG